MEVRRMSPSLDASIRLHVDDPYFIDAKNQLNNFNFRWMLKWTFDEGTTITRRKRSIADVDLLSADRNEYVHFDNTRLGANGKNLLHGIVGQSRGPTRKAIAHNLMNVNRHNISKEKQATKSCTHAG